MIIGLLVLAAALFVGGGLAAVLRPVIQTAEPTAPEWTLAKPGKAGPLRLSADQSLAEQTAQQRADADAAAPPLAAVYEDPADPTHRALLIGHTEASIARDGAQDVLDAYFGKVLFQLTGAALDSPLSAGPGALGGKGRCQETIGYATKLTFCAWAAPGVVVEFTFFNLPAATAAAQLHDMLPVIAIPH